MALISINATVECDACGKQFKASIDPAHSYDNGFEAACEALRAGEGSIEDGIMRCTDCTSAEDRKWIAAHPHFISGVRKSAGGWTVTTYDDTEHFVAADHPIGEPKFDHDVAAWLEEA